MQDRPTLGKFARCTNYTPYASTRMRLCGGPRISASCGLGCAHLDDMPCFAALLVAIRKFVTWLRPREERFRALDLVCDRADLNPSYSLLPDRAGRGDGAPAPVFMQGQRRVPGLESPVGSVARVFKLPACRCGIFISSLSIDLFRPLDLVLCTIYSIRSHHEVHLCCSCRCGFGPCPCQPRCEARHH